MSIHLAPVTVPDFGLPLAKPQLLPETYTARCDEAYARAGCDWLVIYGDREHFANISFLTDFDPRWEEALLLLGPRRTRVMIAGNECLLVAEAVCKPLGIQVVLAQSLSLPGQDRTQVPSLPQVLRDAGISPGQIVGVVGWKYLSEEEAVEGGGMFVPAYYVDALRRAAGDHAAVIDRTEVMMDAYEGLRAVVGADQIAAFEWGASRASTAVWRIVTQAREGDSELLAASRMNFAGEQLTAHVTMSCSEGGNPIVSLRSPTARKLVRGCGVKTSVGYVGGLSARAGVFSDVDPEFLRTAQNYFEGLLGWYEAVDVGARGGDVFGSVTETLARGGLISTLNPGHLVGHDEWVNSPFRPGVAKVLKSGMAFQVDIIPGPIPAGKALNCEDPVVLADAALRGDLQTRHPAVFARIEARRAFMRDHLGIDLKASILPIGSTPAWFPPFWLACDQVLVKG